MATEILDLRRTDQRNTYLRHPFWMTSAAITPKADDKATILFSFPTPSNVEGGRLIVHEICCQIVTAFAGGTITLNVGSHTIATNDAVTGDTATLVDADDYIPTASITNSTVGYYFPAAGDWLTAAAAATVVAPRLIVPAATAVPCISCELASDAAITAGEARIHVLISEVP